MNPETLRILDSISLERNIDRELLLQDLEQAMISAARKHFNSLDTEEFGCSVDRTSGEITLWRNLEDGEREIIPLADMGRIPAQTAKQVMIQRFREDERASLLEQFSNRMGEVVTGTAQRYEGGALVVTIDRAEGFMPRSEQIPGEQFHPGGRVRCLILDVRDTGSQVKIVLSRGHPDFIRRLFESEVPEVAEHIIEIKSMAREAGFRTKVAVASLDSKVDGVGACVGVRGSRIRNIVDELGGEKIDIVRWNESSQILIANALKPAEVEDVSLCFELGRATIIVPDDQLSLAIGRRGQNVRLAARLTGWDIDLLKPAEFAKGLEILEEVARSVEGITDEMLDKMGVLGIISVFDVEEVGLSILQEDLGFPEDVSTAFCEACAARSIIVAEQQQREKEEEDRRRAEEAASVASLMGEQTEGSPVATSASAESVAASILGQGPPVNAPGGDAIPEPAVDDASAVEADEAIESEEETAVVEEAPPPAEESPGTSVEDTGETTQEEGATA